MFVWLLLWALWSKPESGHVYLWYLYSLSFCLSFTHSVSLDFSLSLTLSFPPLFLEPFCLLDV